MLRQTIFEDEQRTEQMRTSGRTAAGAAKKQNRPAAAKSAKKRAGTVKKDPGTRRTAGKNSAGKGVRRSRAVRYETAERHRERQRRKVSEKPQSEYSEESLLTQGREQYRMSMFLTFLVVIVLLIVVGVNAISLGRRLVENKKRLAQLRQEIRMEKERTEDIEEYRRYTQTDAYIEEIAREKLGLIYEGETVFKEDR